ncbi:hypothetical protein Ahy_A03g011221 isoform C [Arachis hypogaea]|uniref:Uncharacterized protein n=1 Tax=Arachis hypogaea TaxID=3818 RepID=A0A445DQ24_ARAHY|nr:hypothetical protein Ahy_A03g011221 isoform C [Arachis hypogaea]
MACFTLPYQICATEQKMRYGVPESASQVFFPYTTSAADGSRIEPRDGSALMFMSLMGTLVNDSGYHVIGSLPAAAKIPTLSETIDPLEMKMGNKTPALRTSATASSADFAYL